MIRIASYLFTLGLALPALAQQDPPKPKATPTEANVAYGKHERQVMDFYKAKSDKPTPVVFAIHGGGWVNGSKDGYASAAKAYNDAGISLIAINSRYPTQAAEAKVEPPVKWPLEDA